VRFNIHFCFIFTESPIKRVPSFNRRSPKDPPVERLESPGAFAFPPSFPLYNQQEQYQQPVVEPSEEEGFNDMSAITAQSPRAPPMVASKPGLCSNS